MKERELCCNGNDLRQAAAGATGGCIQAGRQEASEQEKSPVKACERPVKAYVCVCVYKPDVSMVCVGMTRDLTDRDHQTTTKKPLKKVSLRPITRSTNKKTKSKKEQPKR